MPVKRDSDGALVRAYGLYWSRDAVDWKQKKLQGLRLHYRITIKNPLQKERNCDAWNQRGVYALYSDFQLVYVGLADSDKGIGDRLYSHHSQPRLGDRWDSFSWFGIYQYDDEGDLLRIADKIMTTPQELIRTFELLLILAANPVMNRAEGRFKGAQRINQKGRKQPTNKDLAESLEEIREILNKR